MKKKLLTAIAVLASLCGYAQTKGTSTLGLGINVSTTKIDYNDQPNQPNNDNKSKTSSFSLGYGLFIKDNTRIGIDLQYGRHDNEDYNAMKTYGGNITYQQYYPLIKKLYAYAGGKAGYGYTRADGHFAESPTFYKSNQYSVGAYGGVTWFVSKRFAFETTLLSANAVYGTIKQNVDGSAYMVGKETSFNLKTEGALSNLGFKIYLLF